MKKLDQKGAASVLSVFIAILITMVIIVGGFYLLRKHRSDLLQEYGLEEGQPQVVKEQVNIIKESAEKRDRETQQQIDDIESQFMK